MTQKRFKLHIDKDRCKGCLLCVSVCLRKILRLSQGLNSRGQHYSEISDQDACVGCQHCAQICPDAAIEIDRVVPAPIEDTLETFTDTPGERDLVSAGTEAEAV